MSASDLRQTGIAITPRVPYCAGMPPLHGSIICLLGVVVASTNAAHLNPSPETIACETTLAPKFEQLAVNLEEHSHEIDGAFEKVRYVHACVSTRV